MRGFKIFGREENIMKKTFKKVIALVLCAMMVTSLTACQSDSASTSGSTTYTGSAEGYHGEVKVEVTVNGDTIEAVNVVEHSETEGVGTVAIDEILGWIVENQSLAADTVSGATLTSNAILSAVEQACSEASLDVEALKNKEVAKETSDEVIQMETDALIIGSGAAGLTAAVSAKEQGIENVMVIEKMPFIGGASAMDHGVWAAGAKAQIDAGVTNDSADILYDDLMVLSQGESNPMLTRMFADNSGRALDWLMDNYGMGVDGPSAFEGASVERNFIFDGSGAKLIEVLKKSGLYEKVASLSKKENTYIGKDIEKEGIQLSGGQIQKLFLARALYKNAHLLILDEPTAALDAIAESEMYDQYASLVKNKTSLFISHRLSSTRFCDRIFFLEKGKIAECGTHDELMEKNGLYANMFYIQSQYYKEVSEGEA